MATQDRRIRHAVGSVLGRSVAVPGRRITTGYLPHDDTHQLPLSMLDEQRRAITVIPFDTTARDATKVLDGITHARKPT
jgi:hypothetical protein